MRLLSTIFLLIGFFPFALAAEKGDTIKVKSHQSTDMTWNESYDEWSVFPDKQEKFQKVTMSYTMGCASGGCSEWDYTTRVMALKPTGKYDSTKKQWPTFKVDGQTVDSIKFSQDPTYRTYYDSTNKVTDSFKRDSLRIVQFKDNSDVKKPTDTITAWPANYYNKNFDQSGKVTDSHLVKADTTWQTSYRTYYDVYEVFRNIEIASAITPYGGYMKNNQNGFSNDWEHRMVFDVTDFQKLLSDSVKIRVFYDGWSSGFSATINFHFVKGKPPRSVKSIRKLYQGHFGYKDANDFEQNKMPPVTVDLPTKVDQAKVRVIASGHGFDNNKNCAEFCKKRYFLNVNGQQKSSQLLWRDDCGMNPIFPQGGTWLLNRANWCPGNKVKVYEHEIGKSLKKGKNTLNIDMETINWQGSQKPSYHFAVQLITYKQSNYDVDASLEAIVAPSTRDEYARINPVAMEPEVKVQNTGSKPINNIKFTYHSKNAPVNEYKWEGTLKPYKSRRIKLPSKVKDWRSGDTNFKVTIEKVNGKSDENKTNNTIVSHFNPPPVLPHTFRIWFTTNNQASQNTITITDASGKKYYKRTNFDNNTRYKDTVSLPPGYGEYKLVLNDDEPNVSSPRDENGLYYPFLQQAGSGALTLRGLESLVNILKDFEPNFGTKRVYHFTTGEGFWAGKEKEPKSRDIRVWPNPSEGKVKVKYANVEKNPAQKLKVFNELGQVVLKKSGPLKQEEQINLTHLEPGVYYIQSVFSDEISTKKVITY